MRAHERRVYFYDLVVKRLGKSSQVPDLRDVLAVWQEFHDRGKAFQTRESGNVLYQIMDISIDEANDIATILISVIDRSLPDAAYGDLDSRKVRIFPKQDREGGNISAHLVISLKPDSNQTNTYLCLLESVRRLSATHIQYLLNNLLREEYSANKERFTYPDPGGERKKGGVRRIPYLPLIRLGGHPSNEFLADLENGTIRKLSLVQTREEVPFGDDPYLEEEAFQLTVAVKPNIPRENRWERLTAAVAKRKADFSTGRITFIDPDQNHRTIDFDVENPSVENQAYIKSKMISNIDPLLADASETIVQHFADKMVAMLAAERNCPDS